MSNEFSLFFLLFARISGFFLISPLFSHKVVPVTVRLGLALVSSLLLTPPLSFQFNFTIDLPLLFALQIGKEIAIGYLLGFLFSLIIEAGAFAGQLVGTLMGFSATELLDPLATEQHPLLARTFSIILLTLFLALDLHHPLLRLLFESFELLPVGDFPFNHQIVIRIVEATTRMFHIALEFAAFPLLMLLSLVAVFALLSRFFPIFWVGFPIQLLVGLTALALSIGYFAPILERAFYQFWELGRNLFFQL